MTVLHDLAIKGQSIWLDFIRRSFVDAGELNELVDKGLRGVTSNPSIFQKAITSGTDYDAAIERLVDEGAVVSDIYEHLAVQDIRRACDILQTVYERTDGKDGFVSLEVSPNLAYDTEGTIMEARRLFSMVDRPNVMIKVPATPAGIPAIETLIGEGININVTLMFSLHHYEAVANAYISGLERLTAANVDFGRVASVASFFVSRVDSQVDERLDAVGNTDLQGKIAIANARLAYARFKEVFSGPRWDRLAARGARVQRPLWASTSTKNPDYPKTLYVESLIGSDTVNTLPPATLEEVLALKSVERTIDKDVEEARDQLEELSCLGIDLDEVTEKLQKDGVSAFAEAFDSLLQAVASKVEQIRGGSMNSLSEHNRYVLGAYQEQIDQALAEMDDSQLVSRIWAHSHTVWRPDPDEIVNRLGWLRVAEKMQQDKGCIAALAQDLEREGFTQVIVLGMGGSSLAPEVFGKLFHGASIRVSVLDSTHPATVADLHSEIDPTSTFFIVATKSGSTTETLSFFRYFYNHLLNRFGEEQAGRHFAAITDPGSKLIALADAHNFRATFINDPNIGGRYSALSYFGLVPACLTGTDLKRLLRRGMEAMNNCGAHVTASKNPGAMIGTIMGDLARSGRDKLTIIPSPQIAPFGDWLEQLVAESTGKSGKGILPVVGEAIGAPDVYGDDRLFVYLQMSEDDTHDAAVNRLVEAGYPLIHCQFRDLYDLGAQFFLWEFATAVAGARLDIHPFDQPNVESAKVQARKMMSRYMDTGKLPQLEPTLTQGDQIVYGDVKAGSVSEATEKFLDQGRDGDYIALQAYLQPGDRTESVLRSLQAGLRDRYGLATTLGFGPRFLHSTGQLHKGDAGNGLFVQFVDQSDTDVDIPDEAGKELSSVSFSTLIDSQSLGDRQALLDAGRRVLRVDLGKNALEALKDLAASLSPVQST